MTSAEPAPPARLQRVDLLLLAGLTVVAFVLRYFSPLMPDLFVRPLSGPPVSNCVRSTPIDPQGTPGTLCGLAYPFNKGYPQPDGSLSPPDGQVFDEIYFPVFAHDDLKGIAYFDPEPPLAKLIIAAGEWGWGAWRVVFQGACPAVGKCDIADLGFNPFGWRIAACLFGTLCVPLMYLLAWRLRPDRFFAFAAAFLANLDGMFFVQSRIGMIDIFPIFFILLAYFLFLVHWQSRTPRESLLTLFALGLVLGIAIASKWIALAAWASMLFFLGMRFLRRHLDLSVGDWSWGRGEGPGLPGGAPLRPYLVVALAAFVDIPVLIYVASWIPFFTRGQFHAHWELLFSQPGRVLGDIGQYNADAYTYHANLTETHPYGSPWFSWPFLWRPVLYYAEYTGLGFDAFTGRPLVALMNDLGNPWIWWTSLPALLLMPYYVFKERSFPAALISVGFISQYLPWARITRVIFLYHMFGGLFFMILALAFVLARLARSDAEVRIGGLQLGLSGRQLAWSHLVVTTCFFAFFYPLWTALPLSDQAYFGSPPGLIPGKFWFPSWL